MRKLFVFLLSVAGVVAPATATSAQISSGSQPSIGIRLLEAPVALENDPRARVYIIDHVPAGTTLSRRIAVSSTSDAPVRVQLYGGAAVVSGGSFVAQPAGQNNDLSTWITVAPSVVTIPPHDETTVTATITVPQDATSGEKYGVIWAQPPESGGGGGIAVVNRVGIRVYLSVGSGPAPLIDFTINSLTAARNSSGDPYVTALVHNTGGRALDLTGSLSLSGGPGGTSAGPFPAKLGTTLGIGQTEPVTILLDRNTPSGPWVAAVTLTSDQVTREAKGTITFPTAAGKSGAAVPAIAVPPHRDSNFWFTAVIAVIALGAVGFLVLLVWRRRDREEEQEGTVA